MGLFSNDPKAKRISELNDQINKRKAAINATYNEIGQLYFDQYNSNSVDNTKEINDKCANVLQYRADIEDLGFMILFEQGKKCCSACHTNNDLVNGFCFKCGNKFTEESCKTPQRSKIVHPKAATSSSVQNDKKKEDSSDTTTETIKADSSDETKKPTESTTESKPKKTQPKKTAAPKAEKTEEASSESAE